MSVSLYRKYRPQNFASVSGQKTAVDVITNSILKSRVGHAYLFSGSRGCGKTSVARIFAKAVNCSERQGFEPCGHCDNCIAITAGESLDVIEIDGASNNSVDEIRELKTNVTLAPFNSKYKIYIIDEVHMLSTAAFNALLKTLEEPPEHVIFILATTEPHKVPVTIRSRCQHIPFHSIKPEDIFERLKIVCEAENINADNDALWEISRQADGALRDALSLLEQIAAASGENITVEDVEKVLGAGSRAAFERWIKILRNNPVEAYSKLKSMFDSGASGVRIFEEMFLTVRDLWLVSNWNDIHKNLGASEHEQKFLLDEVNNWKTEELYSLLKSVTQILSKARTGVRNDILLGFFMMKFIGGNDNDNEITNINIKIPEKKSETKFIKNEVEEKVEKEFEKEIEEEAVEIAPELRDEFINTAKDNKFLVYYGLFHTKFYTRKNDLIISIESPYIFEVFRKTSNSSDLTKVFNRYDKIILRHNDNELICPKFSDSDTDKKSEKVKEIEEVKEVETEAKDDKNYSASNNFIDLLARYCDAELILHRRNETAEDEEFDDASLTDLEAEHEKENE